MPILRERWSTARRGVAEGPRLAPGDPWLLRRFRNGWGQGGEGTDTDGTECDVEAQPSTALDHLEFVAVAGGGEGLADRLEEALGVECCSAPKVVHSCKSTSAPRRRLAVSG